MNTIVYYTTVFSNDHIVVQNDNGSVKIKAYDMRTLLPNTWINDEIINFYFQILQKYDHNNDSYFFNSFFMTKLKGFEFDEVKRWTRHINVFSFKKLFFPVNINNSHWVLLVIDIENKFIGYYDSMGNEDSHGNMEVLFRWMVEEAIDKNKDKINGHEWRLINYSRSIPLQTNGFDCGTFVIVAAHFLCVGQLLNYSQDDMNSYREKIGNSILFGTPFIIN